MVNRERLRFSVSLHPTTIEILKNMKKNYGSCSRAIDEAVKNMNRRR